MDRHKRPYQLYVLTNKLLIRAARCLDAASAERGLRHAARLTLHRVPCKRVQDATNLFTVRRKARAKVRSNTWRNTYGTRFASSRVSLCGVI